MKKLLLLLLCLPMIGFGQGQVNCSLLSVADVVIDNPNLSIDILIYNGDTMDAHYTYISQIIDSNGDTTSLGNSMYWFAHIRNDTVAYHYSLPNTVSFSYPISIYFLYTDFNAGGILDTCILSYTPMITPVLKTFVPDDNFEQALINLGHDIVLDDSVMTGELQMILTLNLSNQNIADLTGIEDCIFLSNLDCGNNQLTSLDVSQNTALTYLDCYNNQLTSLDVSGATALTMLDCRNNQLTSLDVSNNTALTTLGCGSNNLTSLDVSQNTSLTQLWSSVNQLTSFDVSNNTALTDLRCGSNLLTSLDVRNGNNTSIIYFECVNNPNLTCINVDDSSWASNLWTVVNGSIDTQHYFSNNCSFVAFDCTDSLEVNDVIIDNANLTMNIAIYNGYNFFLNYPHVAFTIDANGDTIQSGNTSLFGAINLDTTWYNYSLSNTINPVFPLTIYFVYIDNSFLSDTCVLTYNSTSTEILQVSPYNIKRLLNTIDILGRQTKGKKNEPLFYIYDDGTVEKKIIIE